MTFEKLALLQFELRARAGQPVVKQAGLLGAVGRGAMRATGTVARKAFQAGGPIGGALALAAAPGAAINLAREAGSSYKANLRAFTPEFSLASMTPTGQVWR